MILVGNQNLKNRLKLDLVSQILTIYNHHGNSIFHEDIVIEKDSLFRAQIKHFIGTNGLDAFCESNLNKSILISELSELICRTS